ncbi:helix-turn-helix domain-containing protein [Zunongwangia sp. H14]|uniref:helix-turn-helix domain-containing protein n=1 Tax=Zunongwangia sp. H14 TaxID=3240792 RepID=UPI00356286EA
MRDETLQKKVGQRIQELRELKNISQQDLAAKCNFEKSNMSRLEAGRVNSTLSTLNRIAIGLGVNIVELFKF